MKERRGRKPSARGRGGGVRVAAEWEPVTGVLIGWPFRLPKALLLRMARQVDLHVTIGHQAEGRKARAAFRRWGGDPQRLHFIVAGQGDGYHLPRDWGPFAVFDARGNHKLVDSWYLDYPLSGIDRREGLLWMTKLYGVDYRPDDEAPAAVAQALGLPRLELPVSLTGGNLFFDGLGTAFATQILVDENAAMGIPRERLVRILKEELGVARLHIVPNFETPGGIQHIDCLLKLLDEERMLIKRPPPDHSDSRPVEAAAGRLARLRNPHGRPYTLLRIDTPRYDEDRLANYTNAIIVNREVYVPLFGIPGDEQALQTWRAAMPGYGVFGFELARDEVDLGYTDAFHCRIRGIWDRQMLRLTHPRVEPRLRRAGGCEVQARVQDYSGAGLIEDQLRLAWRAAGRRRWNEVRLKPAAAEHAFVATIEGLRSGQTVEYFLSAASHSGRRESLPRTAPQGFYSFRVAEKQ